jgi:hypothetical protein
MKFDALADTNDANDFNKEGDVNPHQSRNVVHIVDLQMKVLC